MATVVSVTQQKGGAGKTSLAVHLATAWASAGRRVALIDSDPQESLTSWHAMREDVYPEAADLPIVSADGWKLPAEIARARKDSDIVVIDTPPHSETAARLSVREADLVLLPLQPTPLDAWATRDTLDLIAREGTPYRLIFNRMPARGRMAEEVRDELVEEGLSVATAALGNRVIYAESFLSGRGIAEMPGKTPAHAEVAALVKELGL